MNDAVASAAPVRAETRRARASIAAVVARAVGLALVAVLACGALAGCARRDDGVSVVRLWVMGREGEEVARLLPEFHRTHPDIRVELLLLPWTAVHEKLLSAYAGDALPDLCQLGNTWIPEFVALDALRPLDDFVATTPDFDAADFFPGIWETNRIDARLYGVPWYVDTRLLFYRKDLLHQAGYDAPPRTWAEFLASMVAVKRVVGEKNYAILLPVNEFEPLLALGMQQGDLLRAGDTRGNFASPGFRAALSFYVKLFDTGLAPRMANTELSNVWNEFGRGFFAYYISGPWNIGEFKRRLPAAQQGDWATAPLPGPDGPGSAVAGGSSLAITRHARDPEAAWKVVQFLSRPENEVRLFGLSGALPPRRSAWRDPVIANDPYARAFGEQLERIRPTPKVPEWERIVTEMQLVADRAAHDRSSVDEAVRELDRRVDAVLEKRRWVMARDAEAR